MDAHMLKVGNVIKHHEDFYEVTGIDEKVHLTRFTSSMISFGGSLSFDSPNWNEVKLPKNKKDLAYIAAVRARQERLMPRMHHDVFHLPDGTVHVQNWISGMGGGRGQHHVHTAADFAEWAKDVDPKYLNVSNAESCCDLAIGQTQEYDGRVWGNSNI